MAKLIKILAAGIRDADAPAASCLAYFYDPGTTTPGTYAYTANTLAGGTEASNPTVLDSDGQAILYCADTANFRIRIRNAADSATLYTFDPAESSNGVLTTALTTDTTNDDALTTPASALSVWMGYIWEGLNNRSSASTAKDLKLLVTGTGAVGRYPRLIESDVFNVLNFGATGDGSTDDSTNIQKAIDAAAAAGGGKVYFPANIYIIDAALAVANRTNVSLIGDGLGTILRTKSTVTNIAAITVSGTTANLLIKDMTIQGSSDGTAAQTSRGISIASTCSRVHVRDVWLTSNGALGFNRGIVCAGTRCKISGVTIDGLVVPSGGSSVGIEFDTSVRLAISDVSISGATTTYGIAAGVNGTPAAATYAVIDNCDVTAATYGLYLGASTSTCSVNGGTYDACVQAGIYLARAFYNVISGVSCYGCTNDGIRLTDDGTNGADHNTISGCSLIFNTRNGIRIATAGAAATAPPRGNVVSGCNIAANVQNGIYCSGDDNLIASNMLMANSFGGLGTYAAIYITTYRPASTDYGGYNNTVQGNTVHEIAGTQEHKSAIEIVGAAGSVVTNVSTTIVIGNNFPEQNASGTPASYTYGISTSSPIMHGNAMGGAAGGVGSGMNGPFVNCTGDTTVLSCYSGGTYTNRGAAGAVVLTMPNLTDTPLCQILRYTVVRYEGQNLTIAAGSGDTIYARNGNTGSIVLTGATDQVVHMVSVGTRWMTDCVDYT